MKVDQKQLTEQLQNRNVKHEGNGIDQYLEQETAEVGFGGAFYMDITKEAPLKRKESGKDEPIYTKPGFRDRDRATPMGQQFLEDDAIDAATRRNQMVVLSNTVSPEDYQKMQEEGFSLSETDVTTMTTVIDKIKVNMAKTGASDVEVDRELAEKVTGDQAIAERIVESLEKEDLPASSQNVQETEKAITQLEAISDINEEATAYLLRNELEPTIENTYVACNSSRTQTVVTEEEAMELYPELEKEIEHFLSENNLELTGESIMESKWLIANDIPLTRENLEKLKAMKEIGAILKEDGGIQLEAALKAITGTIAKGRRPGDTRLSEITRLRQTEETRLMMTTESNRTNKQKGLEEINTKPLEERVDELKTEETSYYEKLLKESMVKGKGETLSTEAIEGAAKLAQDTEAVLAELKTAPAYVVDQLVQERDTSLQELHDKASIMENTLRKAGETYEALMTAPRSDLGDHIQKAFRNVDDILTDLGLENSDVNRRAVRILAYNQREITAANIQEIKQADEQVQRTFKNMTGAVTLEMIRKQMNPLEMSLTELNHAAEDIKEELGDDRERFAEFLWKLDQKQGITKEERESLLGVFRLIHQVEKTDGAVVGMLLQEGAPMTMKNLLGAVRTRRRGSMEYEINNDFAGIDGKKSAAIDEQLERAFEYQRACAKDVAEGLTVEKAQKLTETDWQEQTPEQVKELLTQELSPEELIQEKQEQKAYAKSSLERFGQVLEAGEEVYQMLERYQMPATITNLMAMSEMMRNPNAMFDTLLRQKKASKTNVELVQDLKDQVLEEFGEALENPEDLAEAEEALAELAEKAMETMIIENEDVSALDLRELRQMSQQFSITAKRAEEESYVIPMETGNGIEGISLKIVRGKEVKGLVDILFRGELMGKIAASFQAKEDRVVGTIAVENQETRALLADNLPAFVGAFQQNGGEAIELSVAHIPDMDYEKALSSHWEKGEQKADKAEKNENYEIQTKRLYHIAETFIHSLQDLAAL